MMGTNGGEGVLGNSSHSDGSDGFGNDASVNERFDASQYAFFGNYVAEEVELGGLEDDDGSDNAGLVVDDNQEFSTLGDQDEGEGLGSLSVIDDLTSTFSELNQDAREQAGVIVDRGSFSREGSSAIGWAQGPEHSNWRDQHILDAEHAQDGKRWWSQPHPSSDFLGESKPLNRTSSYPQQQLQLQQQQQQQEHSPCEPLPIPKSSFTSYPPPGGIFQVSPNGSRQPAISVPTSGLQMPPPSPRLSPYSGSQLHLTGLPLGQHYGGNMAQFGPPDPYNNNRQKNHWLNQAGLFPGDHSNMLPHLMQQQQLAHSNGLFPSQLLPQHHQRRLHQLQPSLPRLPNMHLQMLASHPQPQMMNNFEAMHRMVDLRDQSLRPTSMGRQGLRFQHQGSGTNSQRSSNGWPQFWSKHMSSDELENILRIQLTATQSNDPYVDDYYHQACVAKRSAGSRMRHRFFPNSIKDVPSRGHANSEPHAYLQVEGLGRVPFSSIRRPRPLLEVDTPSASSDNALNEVTSTKPLEQEPMLAARITIEDGLSFLLEVDDIDRLLQFSQQQDGGSELKQQRQILLEGLAASLQLVDPLGHSIALVPKDDFVFLRIVSLPKGRKLLSRYLSLLLPGSKLARVVCMAIFRHLRFLFGSLPSDPSAAETSRNLVNAVSSFVCGMDLSTLSACLAAVACSLEQPPLRPLGSPTGDGASVIIKSVLDRATELLTNPNAGRNYSVPNPDLWQASFNGFFVVLTKYCLNKYDTIMHSLLVGAPSTAVIGSEATRAISREIPVELLRASLPHTDENQRKMLLDFARRSMPAAEHSAHGSGGNGPMISESVQS